MENEAGRPRSDDYLDIIRPLPLKLRLAYGVGHVLNDVCASMWFTYLLVFFHLVLKFNSTLSGVILLVGQVADALATPFVGYQSDLDDDFWMCKYGRRKTWHLIGTLCVLGSFPFIFSPCINCENSDDWAQLIYYSAFVIIFQLGWAAVQISHLSLIPDLTPSEHERTELTAIRYSFTVCSNVGVYVITWALLHFTNSESDAQIGPADAYKFQKVAFIGLSIGAVASLVFHLAVKEAAPLDNGFVERMGGRRTAGYMLRDVMLYQVAAVYMSTRLFANLSQIYIPLYLHESLSMQAESLAIIPLVMLLSSFGVSLFIKFLNKQLGRKVAYLLGASLGIIACIWVKLGGHGDDYTKYEIYAVAVLFGAGSSVMLVTSLGITADLIGTNTESGAFVYGAMSFTDKLANGAAVLLIQYMKRASSGPSYYSDILSYVCGGAAILGLLSLSTLVQIGCGKSSKRGGGGPYDVLNSQDETVSRVFNPSIQQDDSQTGLIS